MQASGHQTSDVGHVEHQVGAHFVGDGAQLVGIDEAGIGAGPGQNQPRAHLKRLLPNGFIIKGLGVGVDAVAVKLVGLAADVELGAVAEMAAMVELHGQHAVAGSQQSHVRGLVGGRAGVGLNIGVFSAKELFGAGDGDLLGDVDEFAAAVVAGAGQSLGVFVGEDGAHRRQHGLADVVLRGDQLNMILLALTLLLDGVEDVGVGLTQEGAGVGGLVPGNRARNGDDGGHEWIPWLEGSSPVGERERGWETGKPEYSMEQGRRGNY